MALDRGTSKTTFIYFVETFAMLGTVGGAGMGIYDALGGTPVQLAVGAAKIGLFGFIGGTAAGAALGREIWELASARAIAGAAAGGNAEAFVVRVAASGNRSTGSLQPFDVTGLAEPGADLVAAETISAGAGGTVFAFVTSSAVRRSETGGAGKQSPTGSVVALVDE